MPHRDSKSKIAKLLALPRFTDQGAAAYRPGLERMEALLAAMGAPHRAFPSVHVAGTNGKGSTASMIAAVATAAGRRVGLHTSPHLFHVAERMRLDGVPAPEAWLEGAVARYEDLFADVQPSFFEATTALSFCYFAEAGADLVVAEVGMGGRLDATNVLTPLLAVITNIGLDHTDFLGTTLPEIAREKGGIIKPGVPVVTAAAQPEVVAVLRMLADGRDAPFHEALEETVLHEQAPHATGLQLSVQTPLRRYDNLLVDLAGVHQATNARLALRAVEVAGAAITTEAQAVYEGLGAVRRLAGLRGRLDVLHAAPHVVADVAHNPDGLAVALAFMQAVRAPEGSLYVLFGAMRDKDVAAMARLLADAGAVVTPVSGGGERALDPAELAAVLRRYGVAVAPPRPVSDALADFLRTAPPCDALLVTGSHLVVAQVPEATFGAPRTKFP